jgi:predicted permease
MFPMTLHTIVSIFLIIMLGYVLRKFKFLDRNFIDTVADSLYKILMPFFFFWIITTEKGTGTFGWKVPLIIVFLILFAYLCGYLIAHISKMPAESASSFIRGCYRFDLGLGLAIIYFLFDRSVVRDFCFILIFVLPVVDIISYLSVKWVLKEKKKGKYGLRHVKCIILNPIIIGGVLGWISSEVGLVFPILINKTAEMILSIIFPLVLITTGGAINKGSTSPMGKVFVIGTAAKIFILPLFAYLCLANLAVGATLLSAVIIFFTIPSSLESKVATNLNDLQKPNSFVSSTASIVFFFLSISLWVYILSQTCQSP